MTFQVMSFRMVKICREITRNHRFSTFSGFSLSVQAVCQAVSRTDDGEPLPTLLTPSSGESQILFVAGIGIWDEQLHRYLFFPKIVVPPNHPF